MLAAVIERYGAPDVVRVLEVPRPVPGPGEVLVRVEAAAVTSADARIRAARFPAGFAPFARVLFGIVRPRRRILGGAFAGFVEAVGTGVDALGPGDAVAGMTGMRLGAHAQYVAVRADRVVPVPAGVSLDDAAGVLFGGTTAHHFLHHDRAGVRPGARVLVNGASGAVGTNAVQIARHLGATVTAVTSAANADLVLGLGAHRVIDHTREELGAVRERFDVVMDCVGNLSIPAGRRLLAQGGSLLLVVATLGQMIRARGDVVSATSPERAEDMALLLRMVAEGDLVVVHHAAHPLRDIAEAHRQVDTGRKRGNVLVHPAAG